jgi:hypothetical protein
MWQVQAKEASSENSMERNTGTPVKIKKVKISLLHAVKAPRVARGRGSHITYTNG